MHTGTVSDISDAELVRRALMGAINAPRKRGAPRQPTWHYVMEAFGLGSTYSAQLCVRFGLDPNQER